MVRIMYSVKTWTGLQSPGILASAKEHVISKDSSQINKRCWSALKRRICLYLQQSLLKNWRFAIKKKLEGKNPIQKAIFFRGEVTGEESKGQMISKANCVFLTSPKKRTKKWKNLTCYYYDISSQIFFVRFFGESRTP